MTQDQVNKLTQRQREQLIKQIFKVEKTVTIRLHSGKTVSHHEVKSTLVEVACGQTSTYIEIKV